MIALPSLELRRGAPQTPAARARELADWGAAWVHVVADASAPANWASLSGVLDAGLAVQFSGGARSLTQVQQLLDLGVDRVLVAGPQREPAWLKEAAHLFAGRVLVDVRGLPPAAAQALLRGCDGLALAGAVADGDVAGLRHAAPRLPIQAAGLSGLAGFEEAEAAGASAGILDAAAPEDVLRAAFERWPAPPALHVLRPREDAEE